MKKLIEDRSKWEHWSLEKQNPPRMGGFAKKDLGMIPYPAVLWFRGCSPAEPLILSDRANIVNKWIKQIEDLRGTYKGSTREQQRIYWKTNNKREGDHSPAAEDWSFAGFGCLAAWSLKRCRLAVKVFCKRPAGTAGWSTLYLSFFFAMMRTY